MEEILAVFRSRTQTSLFFNILKSYGINSRLINAPNQLNIGCSIVIKFFQNEFNKVLAVLKRRRFDSFIGFYMVKREKGRINIYPIVQY